MKAILILIGALTIPAFAGTLNFDVNGTLGPVLSGSDPLKLAGQGFVASGSFSQYLTPSTTTPDSATYNLPGTLQIMVGTLNLTGYNATLMITDPTTGPDTMLLNFSVVQSSLSPDVSALLSLPDGTLKGTGLQTFSAGLSQPGSQLLYRVIGGSQTLSGDLGITGTAVMSGAGGSGVPEPGTIVLLGAGLAALLFTRLKSRAL